VFEHICLGDVFPVEVVAVQDDVVEGDAAGAKATINDRLAVIGGVLLMK